MAITALDIKDKQFTTKFRGYNEQEVDEPPHRECSTQHQSISD